MTVSQPDAAHLSSSGAASAAVSSAAPGGSSADTEAYLQLAGITVQFPGVLALDQVSLDVRRGEVHGLMGENGAGKSTLLKVLSGVNQPAAGTLALNGVVQQFTTTKAATGIAYQTTFATHSNLNTVTTMHRHIHNRRRITLIILRVQIHLRRTLPPVLHRFTHNTKIVRPIFSLLNPGDNPDNPSLDLDPNVNPPRPA